MKSDIINKLEELLKQENVEKLQEEVEHLEEEFVKVSKEREEELRKAHEEAGGSPESFLYSAEPEDHRFKELLHTYEDRMHKWEQSQRSQEQANLEAKQQILEELKKLIAEEESIGSAFNHFNELRAKWKSIGNVPAPKYKELQTEYGHQIDLFFYTIKIYKDLKELDLRKNLEQKQELVKQMKELVSEKSIRKTENIVKALQEEWHEIGPVPHQEWEGLRDEFKAATQEVYNKIQSHYDALRAKRQENLEEKQKLIQKMHSINANEYHTHKKWQKKTEQVLALQEEWKHLGFAPRDKNEQVWQEFRAECDRFFQQKQQFYDNWKKEKEVNKKKKEELLRQAEELKESTDWKNTTNELIRLQKLWTATGSAGRKDEQELWKNFRAACDHFFNTKKEYFEHIDEHQQENQKQKEALIARIEAYEVKGETKEHLKELREFVKEWNEIGHVPRKELDRINAAFKSAMDSKYNQLKIDKDEKEKIRYKNKLERLVQSNESDKLLYRERKFIEQNIQKLEATIEQYEHNMSFFNISKNAAPLLKEVEQKLEQSKKEVESLKQRLKLLKGVAQ